MYKYFYLEEVQHYEFESLKSRFSLNMMNMNTFEKKLSDSSFVNPNFASYKKY